MTSQVNNKQVSDLLKKAIENQVDAKGLAWINQQESLLTENFKLNSFYLTFSSATRYIEKDKLLLSQDQVVEALGIREGFQPQYWNLLQTVRVYFLLKLPAEDGEVYLSNLTKLFETADVEEQVTLYGALPILAFPDQLKKRAAEGLRTNITDVFDAIALHNPYPHDYFDEDAWNQMVLKAVFMRRPLYQIFGADNRVNPNLATMLTDYAHERWAANRSVIPELWRFVGPFLSKESLQDIERVINGEPREKKAGLLACSNSDLPEALELLNQYPEIKNEIKEATLTWDILGKESTTETKN